MGSEGHLGCIQMGGGSLGAIADKADPIQMMLDFWGASGDLVQVGLNGVQRMQINFNVLQVGRWTVAPSEPTSNPGA
jgi:hypothetical protein